MIGWLDKTPLLSSDSSFKLATLNKEEERCSGK